jgi:hypothetical protein
MTAANTVHHTVNQELPGPTQQHTSRGFYAEGQPPPGTYQQHASTRPFTANQPTTGAPQAPICRTPGCENPVRIQNGFIISEYCSSRHAEYVLFKSTHRQLSWRLMVNDGRQSRGPEVDLCIMCQRAPQCQTDRFCSQECRERAMSKNWEVAGNKCTSYNNVALSQECRKKNYWWNITPKSMR